MSVDPPEPEALPQWDLSNVYPGLESEPFEQALADLRAQLDGLDRYLADNDVRRAAAALPADRLAAVIAGYLERMNAAERLHLTLRYYTWAFVTTGSYNALARRRYSEREMLGVEPGNSCCLRASAILARRRHSSAVEQLFRKSLALCAVLQAWMPDANGHTYQLFVSRGRQSRIAATARFPPEPT